MMARATFLRSPLFRLALLFFAAQAVLFWVVAVVVAWLFRAEFVEGDLQWVPTLLTVLLMAQLAWAATLVRRVRREGWGRSHALVVGYLLLAWPPIVALALVMGR